MSRLSGSVQVTAQSRLRRAVLTAFAALTISLVLGSDVYAADHNVTLPPELPCAVVYLVFGTANVALLVDQWPDTAYCNSGPIDGDCPAAALDLVQKLELKRALVACHYDPGDLSQSVEITLLAP